MRTGQKRITYRELVEYGAENGYLFALYERADETEDFRKVDPIADIEDDNLVLVVETFETYVRYNFAMTEDGLRMLLLHNNFNLPETYPAETRISA
jgi:hypothetical protein